MNTSDIEKIIKIFEGANVSHLDLEIDNIKIKLDKKEVVVSSTPVVNQVINNQPVETKTDVVVTGEVVTSPLVGTFYQAPSSDAESFVKVGSRVAKGDKLCIIEAMKVMNEITAPCDGVIKEICVQNEKMVEYGQKLFVIGE